MASTLRTSPLNPLFTEVGYAPVPANPQQAAFYTSAAAEYNALMHGAAIRDVTTASVLELRGKDALDFLHRVSTNDLKKLFPGGLARTIFTTDKGRILDSTAVMHLGDRLLLYGNYGAENLLYGWLNKYIIMDDVTVHRVPADFVLLEVLGVQAEALMTLLFGKDVQELSPNVLTQSIIENQSIPFYRVPSLNGRHRYLILTTAQAASVVIKTALAQDSPVPAAMVGETAYERYRVEHGILSRNELHDLYNPHEALLTAEVSSTKGCYIGQEVIARLETYDKVQKYLSGILLKGEPPAMLPAQIFSPSGEEAGTITSLTWSPRLNRHVGMAYIRRRFNGGDGHLTLNGQAAAEIKQVQLPVTLL